MMNLANIKSTQTITTLQLREMINGARAQAGELAISNTHFIDKVRDELDLRDDNFFTIPHEQNHKPQLAASITIEQATLVGMRESKGVRRAVLDVLKELTHSNETPALPQDYIGALKALVASEEAKQSALHQLSLAAPKAEFVDSYVAATSGSQTFRQVCKLLGANEGEFRAFLVKEGVMYKLNGEWAPTAYHINMGRFEVRTGINPHSQHAYSSALFTAKGVAWASAEWGKYKQAN